MSVDTSEILKIIDKSARRHEFLSTVHAHMKRCAFVTRRRGLTASTSRIRIAAYGLAG